MAESDTSSETASAREALVMQRCIAAVFLGLGSWCLFAPGSVIALGVRPEHQSQSLLSLVLMGAFGAQACLGGLFAWFATFTRRTFIAYGIALLPFFVFDWWFYAVRPVLNELVLIDAIGNLAMLLLCWRGAHLLRYTATK